ncbi:inositol monophosphatase family protein [Nocardiopsis sp. CNS-639]|uniref:inositol monophosphatase family protein n=1 Tax=Nocardiopsis sp. CNS-639 TaxID=1169153 RepID=UPI0003A306B0|nr:inositol monophosphatase family protein [Nocardiopsis sp. CNS-639]
MTDPAVLVLAHHLADRAGAIAQHHLAADGLTVRTKGDGSPVTDVDREIEQTLWSQIRQRYSNDALLGEESDAFGTAHRRWIIDGIDGTASFIAGEPEWSTLIAIEEGDDITLGMVSAPALGRRWWAVPGTGSWEGPYSSQSPTPPHRLSIADGGDVHDATLGIWPPSTRMSESQRTIAATLAEHVAHTRPLLEWSTAGPTTPAPRKPSAGSGTCHGGLLVATGQLDAFLLMGAGPWDIAALVPIVQEAGGVFSDLAGQQRIDTGVALFARSGLHQQLLDIVASAC